MESENINQQPVKNKLSPEEIARIMENKVYVDLGVPINLDNLQEYSNINFFGKNKRYPKRKRRIEDDHKKFSSRSEFTGPFDMTFLCSDNTPMKKTRTTKRKLSIYKSETSKPNYINYPYDNNSTNKRKFEENEKIASELESIGSNDFTFLSSDKNPTKKRKLQRNSKKTTELENTEANDSLLNITKLLNAIKTNLVKYMEDKNANEDKLRRHLLFVTKAIEYDKEKKSIHNYSALFNQIYGLKQGQTLMKKYNRNMLGRNKHLLLSKTPEDIITKQYTKVLDSPVPIKRKKVESTINKFDVNKAEKIEDVAATNLSSSENAMEYDCNTGELLDDPHKKKLICNIVYGDKNDLFDFSDVGVISNLLKGNNKHVVDITNLIEDTICIRSAKSFDVHNSNEVSLISEQSNSGSLIDEIKDQNTMNVDSALLTSISDGKNLIDNTMQEYVIYETKQNKTKRKNNRFSSKLNNKDMLNYHDRFLNMTNNPSVNANSISKNLSIKNVTMYSNELSLMDNLTVLKHHTLAAQKDHNCPDLEFNYIELMKIAIQIDVSTFSRECTPLELKIANALPLCPNNVCFKVNSSNPKHRNLGAIIERGLHSIQKMYRIRGDIRCTTNTRIIKHNRDLYIILFDEKSGHYGRKDCTRCSGKTCQNSDPICGCLLFGCVCFFEAEDIYDIEQIMESSIGLLYGFSILRAKGLNIKLVDLTNDRFLSYYYLNGLRPKNICDVIIRIIKTNFSFFKFRLMCNHSQEIMTELENAGIPLSMEKIIGPDILPFVRVYLKWFDNMYNNTKQFDVLSISVLRNLLKAIIEKNRNDKKTALDIINRALGTLYSFRLDSTIFLHHAPKRHSLIEILAENINADKSENNVQQISIRSRPLQVEIIDHDGILNDIQENSDTKIINKSNDIVNLVGDNDEVTKNSDSKTDDDVVMCDSATFSTLNLFEAKLIKRNDKSNDNGLINSPGPLLFQSATELPADNLDIESNDPLSLQSNDVLSLSVNHIIDVNLNLKGLRPDGEESLLSACDQLVSYAVDGEINTDDLNMPTILSSSIIDMPFGFDNAGTLLH